MNQEQLSHTLFPIGHLQKSQVRELARKFGLPTAAKKDSQGLCFIGKVDMKEFLSHYMQSESGDVLDEKGEIIGRHDGAVFYTIGERHGFRITSQNNAKLTQNVAEEKPRYYVVAKDIEKNTITVGENITENPDFFTRSVKKFVITDIHWISGIAPDLSETFDIRFRYRQEKQKCKIIHHGDTYEIIPEKPQFGIASGQSAVIYNGDVCLGGGVIQ